MNTLDFYKFLYEHAPNDSICVLSLIKAGDKGLHGHSPQFKRSELDKMAKETTHQNSVGNTVYMRTTVLAKPTEYGRGVEKDTLGTCVLWTDIDTRDKTQALDALKAFSPEPSVIISTGGGFHAYWKLSKFEVRLLEAKRRNMWIRKQLLPYGADAVQSMDHILRPAGTINRNYDPVFNIEVVHSNDKTYVLEDFESEYLPNEKMLDVALDDPTPLPDNFLEDLDKKAPHVRKRIISEPAALEAGASLALGGDGTHNRVDRSLNDFCIVASLLDLGYSPSQCTKVLTHPIWFSGSKTRQKGTVEYARRTVSKAYSQAGESNSKLYFEDKTFIPEKMASHILKNEHVLTHTNGKKYGRMWRYDKDLGKWSGDGSAYIASRISSMLGKTWRHRYESETIHKIEVDTAFASHDKEFREKTPTRMVNLLNGMLDIDTRELHPHSPSYRSIQQMPVSYNPLASTSEVSDRVDSILTETHALAFYEFLGYTLQTEQKYKKFLFLYGGKHAGKTTLLNTVRGFLGKENCSSEDIVDLFDGEYSLIRLLGKFANICGDVDTSTMSKRFSRIKNITGGEVVSANEKHLPQTDFLCTAKLYFAGNNYPRLASETDNASINRFLIIPCESYFEPGAPGTDFSVEDQLSTPLNQSALLNLALDGWKRLNDNNGFTQSKGMENAYTEFYSEIDSVFVFMKTLELVPGGQSTIRPLHHAYIRWCNFNQANPVGEREFRDRFIDIGRELGIVVRFINGKRVYENVELPEYTSSYTVPPTSSPQASQPNLRSLANISK